MILPIKSRVVLYGESKVGVSSFLSNLDNAYFIDTNDSLGHLSVNKVIPKNYKEIKDILKSLRNDMDGKEVIVIDHLLGLERLIFEYVCETAEDVKYKCIDDFPYGKGYIYAIMEFCNLLKYLNFLRNKNNISIVIAGHSEKYGFTDPRGNTYNYYAPYMIGKTHKGEDPVQILTQWSDALLYMTYQASDVDDYCGKDRKIYAENSLLFRAGNRIGLKNKLANEYIEINEGKNE